MQKIQKNRKPDLILTADWHLREDTPVCFTGDFQAEQWTSINSVSNLQRMYDCPVIHAGDLFHHWKPSPWLLSMAIQRLPDRFHTIYGQHDLPQHNWELREKSGIATLENAGKLIVLPTCHYGQIPVDFSSTLYDMLVWHHMTYKGNPPFPGARDGQSSMLLRKYPQFDLIVTGDNHQSFTTTYENRLLVNPGNLTRQVASQIDFKPCVYLWYADTNTAEPVYLPIQEGVISRDHLEKTAERDARIDAFVSKIGSDWTIGMSFEENLEKFKMANDVRPEVMEIIYKALE